MRRAWPDRAEDQDGEAAAGQEGLPPSARMARRLGCASEQAVLPCARCRQILEPSLHGRRGNGGRQGRKIAARRAVLLPAANAETLGRGEAVATPNGKPVG